MSNINIFFGVLVIIVIGGFIHVTMEAKTDDDIEVIGIVAWEPNKQFVINEICVNYLCHKGMATAAISDKIFYLTRNGRTLEVLVEKLTIVDDHYFFTFEHQRGFFSIGIYDKVAFVYLDKDNIILHIDKSSLNPNHK